MGKVVLHINKLPKIEDAVYFSNRVSVLEPPLIKLPNYYGIVLLNSLYQDGLISKSFFFKLLDILCDLKGFITLSVLESVAPSRYRTFRWLRSFFREEGPPARYNPIIPRLKMLSIAPVLYTMLASDKLNAQALVIDAAESIDSIEEIVNTARAYFAEVHLVVSNLNATLLGLANEVVVNPSLAPTVSYIERYGIKLRGISVEGRIISLKEEESYKPARAIILKPKPIDRLKIALGEDAEAAKDLLSEVASSGVISEQAVLELLNSERIPIRVYFKLIRYGFIKRIVTSGGIQITITEKGLEELTSR